VPRPNDPTRWDDLRVLLAILRQGSFSGAATSLSVEQSTVSRRIAALEAALGGALFDRTPAGPRPTELALELRAHAERVEREVQGLLDQASAQHGAVAGRIRLATTESFAVHVLIPRLLGPLRARHPELRVDLVLGERAADLSQREADLALRFFRPSEGDLVAKRIAVMPTAVLAHERYLERFGPEPGGLRFEQLDWIVPEYPHPMQSATEQLLERAGVEPLLRTSGHLAQVEAVRAGLGVALLTRTLLRLDPGLRVLELGLPPTPTVELWLVAPRGLSKLPRVRAVWEFLEAELATLNQAAPAEV
jgi:DNA-binding transcriptional LysR family regulator